MKEKILSQLNAACPWRDTLYIYDTIDSTNTAAKVLAQQGAPQGTILIARQQTGGRGRMGRSFCSPAGMGVYLSVLLRPQCPPEQLMHLTCAAGTAMCDAILDAAGFRPGVKWINDLVYGGRKLGGILTELAIDAKTGLTSYAVVGIGINCRQRPADFPAEIRDMAGSLSMVTGTDTDCSLVAAAMVSALFDMTQGLLTEKAATMDRYRADCITLGQEISIHRDARILRGTAMDIDDDGGLVVRWTDGSQETVQSGEVSVRGLYGYI